jgi:hypothetical protein
MRAGPAKGNALFADTALRGCVNGVPVFSGCNGRLGLQRAGFSRSVLRGCSKPKGYSPRAPSKARNVPVTRTRAPTFGQLASCAPKYSKMIDGPEVFKTYPVLWSSTCPSRVTFLPTNDSKVSESGVATTIGAGEQPAEKSRTPQKR